MRAELASVDLEEALPLVRRRAPPPPPARASAPPPARSRDRLAPISAAVDRRGDPLDVVLAKANELEVIQGPLEGGAWALRTALALVPSRGALVCLLDPSRAEFFVTSTFGDDGEAPLGHRFQANDRFLALVTSSRRARAVALADLTKLGVAFPARQMDFGWPDEVIVVPIFAGERLIAAIELIDPLAKADEAQFAAMAYLAQRLASFLTADSAGSRTARTG